MATFTAEYNPSGFVLLTLTDLAGAAVATITRTPSVAGVTVRGTPTLLDAGGALVLTDTEYPFGQPITYTAVLRDPATNDETETLTAAVPAIALAGTGMVISDPLTGRSVLVDVHDQRDERSDARAFRYSLAGVAAPMFTTDYHAGWTWVLDVRTDTAAERAQLDGLLRDGGPVLLRVGASCDLRQGWVVPADLDVRRWSIPATDPRRLWTVPVAAVDAPPSTFESVAVTLADLHDYEPSTLQALADRPPATLLDLTLAVIADA